MAIAASIAALALTAVDAEAQVPPETEERLRAIFEGREFNARGFHATWLLDGSGYTVLERRRRGRPGSS